MSIFKLGFKYLGVLSDEEASLTSNAPAYRIQVSHGPFSHTIVPVRTDMARATDNAESFLKDVTRMETIFDEKGVAQKKAAYDIQGVLDGIKSGKLSYNVPEIAVKMVFPHAYYVAMSRYDTTFDYDAMPDDAKKRYEQIYSARRNAEALFEEKYDKKKKDVMVREIMDMASTCASQVFSVRNEKIREENERQKDAPVPSVG